MTSLIPKEMLANRDDPEAKKGHWKDEIEPCIMHIIDAEEYLVIGIALYTKEGWNNIVDSPSQWIFDAEKFFYAKPALVNIWLDRLLRILHREFNREPQDANDQIFISEGRASHESRAKKNI